MHNQVFFLHRPSDLIIHALALVNTADRYFTETPIYSFGHGLRYSTFVVTADTPSIKISSGTATNVTITVRNTGTRAADEVVMAFFRASQGVIPADEPAASLQRQLFDFARVHVAAGETTTVSFEVSASAVTLIDQSGSPKLWPGEYVLDFTNGGVTDDCVARVSARVLSEADVARQ